MLIIANTSSSQNKISIFLVLLNTFKKLLGVKVFFLREVKSKGPKVFVDAHVAVNRF